MRDAARAGGVAALTTMAVACGQGGLDPRGPEADRLAVTWWVLLAIAGVVFVIVAATFVIALRHRPDAGAVAGRTEAGSEPRIERRFVIGGGIVLPAVILAVLLVANLGLIRADGGPGELALEVTGHRYWWEVDYGDFETANVVTIPTGTPVELTLSSDDVIHSFWVPELAGKVDLVPGRENRMVIEATDPGRYIGRCAEYCGLQHAWMLFEVVALAPDEFERWRATAAGPAVAPTSAATERGRDVFLANSCVGCHTIRGVSDVGDAGPDLTHLADRRELGAGIIANDPTLLRTFIANPQAIKPGVNMPPQSLTEDQLDDLIAYLGSLE